MEIIVDEFDNVRLDSYISTKDESLSRATIQKLLESNNITVNGEVKKSSYKVKAGDVIKIDIPEAKDIGLVAQDIPVEIVYEDSDIIVVTNQKEWLFIQLMEIQMEH